ncbi:MAG TPA: hypothetical protein VI636_21230 [Candidatus Angelobacter sp.]
MFHSLQRLALLVMAAVVIQPLCPALLHSPAPPSAAPADSADCHGSAPAMPLTPSPTEKCCVASHWQVAMPALRYASPPPSVTQPHVSQPSVWTAFDPVFDSPALFSPSNLPRSSPVLRI